MDDLELQLYSLRTNIEADLYELVEKMGFDDAKDFVLSVLDDIQSELEDG